LHLAQLAQQAHGVFAVEGMGARTEHGDGPPKLLDLLPGPDLGRIEHMFPPRAPGVN
jgi:hypothetical protein